MYFYINYLNFLLSNPCELEIIPLCREGTMRSLRPTFLQVKDRVWTRTRTSKQTLHPQLRPTFCGTILVEAAQNFSSPMEAPSSRDLNVWFPPS